MRILSIMFLMCAVLLCVSCGSKMGAGRVEWFPKIEPEKLEKTDGLYFIKDLQGYQQTTEYTAGPAVLLALAKYYGIQGIEPDKDNEMRIAKEAGTRSLEAMNQGGKPGTKPNEMVKWLEANGFAVKVEYEDKGDGSALKKLKENIKNGIPTIVEWVDLGGTWAIVVGYDTRGNDDPWDDVLIMADPYDKYDDHQDGYSFVNANRFYWLWFDAFYFDTITWRTMITAVPKK